GGLELGQDDRGPDGRAAGAVPLVRPGGRGARRAEGDVHPPDLSAARTSTAAASSAAPVSHTRVSTKKARPRQPTSPSQAVQRGNVRASAGSARAARFVTA